MVGWYHRFNGHELVQTPGDDERQGGLECYSPCRHEESDVTWQHEESDMTWQPNNNILNQWKEVHFFVSLFALMFIWLHWASVAACEI